MSNADKLNELESLLEGDALTPISGISIDPKNYDLIVTSLLERYDDEQERKDRLHRQLRHMQPLNLRDPVALRKEVDRITGNLRELVGLGLDPSGPNDILLQDLQDILPQKWNESWVRSRIGKGQSNLDEMLDFIRSETRIIEKSNRTQAGPQRITSEVESTSNIARRNSPVPMPRRSLTSALPATISPRVSRNPFQHSSLNSPSANRTCLACKKPAHSCAKCWAFQNLNPQSRIQIIKSAGLCDNCLGPHHRSKCSSMFCCEIVTINITLYCV